MGVETIALAATIGGTVMSAVGNIQASQAAAANANYQAQIADMNSKVAKQNADYERALGEQKETDQQMKTRAVVGGIIASQGANNLDVNSGSNLDVRTSAMSLGRYDALTIKNAGERNAYNFDVEAANKTAEGAGLRSEAKSDTLAGWINASGSLLGGASQAGNQYARFNAQSGYDPLGVY